MSYEYGSDFDWGNYYNQFTPQAPAQQPSVNLDFYQNQVQQTPTQPTSGNLDSYRGLNWGQAYNLNDPMTSSLIGSHLSNTSMPLSSILQRNGYTGPMTTPGEDGSFYAYNTSPELLNWLNQGGYSLREAQQATSGTGGENYYGLFKGDNLQDVGSYGYSHSGGWMEPLVKTFLGAVAGGALSTALGGMSGGSGISGSEAAASNGSWDVSGAWGGGDFGGGDIFDDMAANFGGSGGGADPFVFNAAQDSQLANMGGADVWGSAGGGMTGATVPNAVPPGVNLGGLGGVMGTGAAAAVPGVFNNAQDSQAAHEQMGTVPGATPGEIGSAIGNPAIPTGTGTNQFGPLGDILRNLAGSLQNFTTPQGLAGLMGMFNANRQNNMLQEQMGAIDRMFATDSPYAQQMAHSLAVKDSAAGRNSQYGPRARELAAQLTSKKADMTKDMIGLQDRMNNNYDSQIQDLAYIFNQGGSGSIFNTMSGSINDLLKLIGEA